MLPTITRKQILGALQQFDQELRSSPEWAAWEQNKGHKWAIVHAAQRYPVKQIVALAAGVVPSSFSGGAALNNRVTRLGFVVERLEGRDPVAPAPTPLPNQAAPPRQLQLGQHHLHVLEAVHFPFSPLESLAVSQVAQCKVAIVAHQMGQRTPNIVLAAIQALYGQEARTLIISRYPLRTYWKLKIEEMGSRAEVLQLINDHEKVWKRAPREQFDAIVLDLRDYRPKRLVLGDLLTRVQTLYPNNQRIVIMLNAGTLFGALLLGSQAQIGAHEDGDENP